MNPISATDLIGQASDIKLLESATLTDVTNVLSTLITELKDGVMQT
jgi:hypothetical protein